MVQTVPRAPGQRARNYRCLGHIWWMCPGAHACCHPGPGGCLLPFDVLCCVGMKGPASWGPVYRMQTVWAGLPCLVRLGLKCRRLTQLMASFPVWVVAECAKQGPWAVRQGRQGQQAMVSRLEPQFAQNLQRSPQEPHPRSCGPCSFLEGCKREICRGAKSTLPLLFQACGLARFPGPAPSCPCKDVIALRGRVTASLMCALSGPQLPVLGPVGEGASSSLCVSVQGGGLRPELERCLHWVLFPSPFRGHIWGLPQTHAFHG